MIKDGLYLNPSGRLMLFILSLINRFFLNTKNEQLLINDGKSRVFASNHNSYFETALLAAFLMSRLRCRKVSFLINWTFSFIPVIRSVLRHIDPVYVYSKRPLVPRMDRKRPRNPQDAIGEVLKRLEKGTSIVIFPEGGLSKKPGELRKGHNGIGKIALVSGAPVQPIGIDFPARVKHGRIPVFGRLIITIGMEMQLDEERSAYKRLLDIAPGDRLIRRRLASGIEAEVTRKIMLEISSLCGKEYPYPADGGEKRKQ